MFHLLFNRGDFKEQETVIKLQFVSQVRNIKERHLCLKQKIKTENLAFY